MDHQYVHRLNNHVSVPSDQHAYCEICTMCQKASRLSLLFIFLNNCSKYIITISDTQHPEESWHRKIQMYPPHLYKLLSHYLGEWKTIYHTIHYCKTVNYDVNYNTLQTCITVGVHCSIWTHSARVCSSICFREMDCIPVAYCGWADRIVAYTDSMVLSIHFEHWL